MATNTESEPKDDMADTSAAEHVFALPELLENSHRNRWRKLQHQGALQTSVREQDLPKCYRQIQNTTSVDVP